MQTLRRQLRRFTAGGILLREVRGIRQELAALTAAVTHIGQELQRRNDREYGQVLQVNPDLPPVEVSYADDLYAQRIADITARRAQATGAIPTDDEVFDEYCRTYPDSVEAQEVRQQEALSGVADLGQA